MLKFHVRIWTHNNNTPLHITDKWIRIVFKNPYPTPMQQIDYLITFVGNTIKYPGLQFMFSHIDETAKGTLMLISATASINFIMFSTILVYATKLQLVEIESKTPKTQCRLTIEGWQRYEQLKKGISHSKIAFMAMQFDAEQKQFIDEKIKPMIKEKFDMDLSILSDFFTSENTIDIKLRNAIRECKFLICDLTHRNNGAYWEAGFAEGLGKPVIYICEQASFKEGLESKDKNKKLHFDVDHQDFYRWEKGNENENEVKNGFSIKEFLEKLEAKIKASI